MAIIDFGSGCDPQVLLGTGRLFITSGGDELDAGNFMLVDFIGDSEVRRVFLGADEEASTVQTTGAYRLELNGDSFSEENFARLINEDLESEMDGTRVLNLRTTRTPPIYQLRFEREYPPTSDCNAPPRMINIYFWRCYMDAPFSYTFSQDEQTVHRFVFITLPAPVTHPLNPLGMITMDPVA